ncbi:MULTISPECIES: hypothetical protein [unclassified Microbacterium]|uniref:hypothetical protein n=1 Tax=unclassified Microbacterium TaxID=2609290 RepID=UPI003C2B3CE2
MDTDYPQNFSDALVSEIKAEMGRRDLSSRGLGRLIGKSSQYMSDRLDGGNSKTGKRVTLNVTDLFAIAAALDLDAATLIETAQRAATTPSNVVTGRFGVGTPAQDELDAVARPTDPEPDEEP